MGELIPPLPALKISPNTKRYIDQGTIDQAMLIIYERRPDFFRRSAQRDKKWKRESERGETPDAKAWGHDEFCQEFERFIGEDLAKEMNLPTLIKRTRVYLHAQSLARVMYGLAMPRGTDRSPYALARRKGGIDV